MENNQSFNQALAGNNQPQQDNINFAQPATNNNQVINNEVNNTQPEQPVIQEQVKQVNQPVEEKKDLGRHTIEDPYTEVKRLSSQDEEDGLKRLEDNTNGSLLMPSGTFKEYVDYFEKLPQSENDAKEYGKKLTEDEALSIQLQANSDRQTILNNVLVDNLKENRDNLVNDVVFGDKKLNTRPINISTGAKLTQASSVALLTSLIGVGEITQVPLWHSGFWVTLRPIKQKDFINLTIAINSTNIRLGRDTNSLVYSNYSVVFNKILTDFIISNITEYSVKLNEDEDIRDLIKMSDLYPLVNGLLAAMYPKGLDIIKTCINNLKLDPQSQKPLCNFMVTAKVDPRKLLWVNRKALDDTLLAHMSKRTSGSVTSDQCREYQERIKNNTNLDVELVSDNDVKMIFTLRMPSLREYIDLGEQWVNDIITYTESLYAATDTDTIKMSKLDDVILASKMNTYNSFITKIVVDPEGRNIVFDQPENMREPLDIVSNDPKLYGDLITAINKFVTESAIAIVATPNYICPECKASQSDIENKTFEEFIPLNVIENFFVLSDLKIRGMRQKGIL